MRTIASLLRPLAALGAALALLLAPAANAQQRAAAADPLAQDYQPAPALWRLADADTTIYLFGTFHLLPEGFRWRNPQFDRIVAEVDELVLESSEADALASLEANSPKLEQMALRRGSTSARLPVHLRGRWRSMIETSGLPFDVVDRMPLAMAVLGFGISDPEQAGPSSYEYGVETVLAREFAESGRPVGSIENHAGVMMNLMRIDEAAILRELARELAGWTGKQQGLISGAVAPVGGVADWSMEHAWARGELDENFDLGLGNGEVGRQMHRVLLAQRNRAWAAWLDDRLDRPGKILVAVGAGHYEGRENLLDFLAERGLTPVRIN